MAVYSIKNISASAVVWSSQTIQPNEAIDINYENLYDKTTDLGISQDAINVSTLAQEDKILLCVDDVASTKEDTLEFIRELHNKNNVLEIPTKFLPSKHSNKWEHEGDKLFHLDSKIGLGTSNPSRLLTLSDNQSYMSFIATGEQNKEYVIGSDGHGFVIYNQTDSKYKLIINKNTGDFEIKSTVLIDDNINSQIQLKNSTNLWDFRVGDTGDLIFKSLSVEKLRFKTDGSLSTSNGLVVTESPYFTDGWVNVPSSWVSSYVTTAETLQYRVDETGTIEFCGRCYNTSATSSRQFPIINANGLPSYLRPDVKQRGTLACEVSGVTTCLYYYMSTNSQLYIYQDSDSSGTFSAGSCYVAMTTLKYKISG